MSKKKRGTAGGKRVSIRRAAYRGKKGYVVHEIGSGAGIWGHTAYTQWKGSANRIARKMRAGKEITTADFGRNAR